MISVKPLDVEMMKRLGTRVNLIPVIAKADTMTQEDLHNFKYIVSLIIPRTGLRSRTDPRSHCCSEHQDLQPTH
jgi:cell division control protein 12